MSRKMLKAGANIERTILDYLNEDCWREVLRYVPVQDIVQSEQVSRRWQQVVLVYLQSIRFSFLARTDETYPSNAFSWKLRISMYESFARWTAKLGSAVVAIAIHCSFNQESLKITKNCHNLEALELINFEELKSKRKKSISTQNFKCLKKISFNSCIISDQCVNQYIADKALEDLEFCLCFKLTGQCLTSANLSNIKSLVIISCPDLLDVNILAATNQLCKITKLVLNCVPKEILKEIQLVLDRMPKLEQLELLMDQKLSHECCLKNYEALCQLSHLKLLKTDLQVEDNAVAAITQCCKELHTLHLGDCEYLSMDGFDAICRNAGARLTNLGIHSFLDIMDDNVVNCIRSCPKLTKLAVGGDNCLTNDLPRFASARHDISPGHKLTLDLRDAIQWHPIEAGADEIASDQEDEDMQEYVIRKWEDLIVYIRNYA